MPDELIGQPDPSSTPAGGGGTVESAPAPIELREDSLIRVPGVDKPVKYADHFGGLRSNLTRAQQEAAELRRQSEGWSREKAEYDRKLRALVGATQDAAKSGNKPEFLSNLKKLSYLTGEDAAQLFEHIQGQNQQFGQQLSARDQVLVFLAKTVADLQKTANQYRTETAQATFDNKISKVAKDLGIPERAVPRLKSLYLSYEQDEALDAEFPDIAKQWWDDVLADAEEARKARMDSARRQPFVPGKGGNATPSKALDTSKLSLDELADAFFPMAQGE